MISTCWSYANKNTTTTNTSTRDTVKRRSVTQDDDKIVTVGHAVHVGCGVPFIKKWYIILVTIRLMRFAILKTAQIFIFVFQKSLCQTNITTTTITDYYFLSDSFWPEMGAIETQKLSLSS